MGLPVSCTHSSHLALTVRHRPIRLRQRKRSGKLANVNIKKTKKTVNNDSSVVNPVEDKGIYVIQVVYQSISHMTQYQSSYSAYTMSCNILTRLCYNRDGYRITPHSVSGGDQCDVIAYTNGKASDVVAVP